MSYCNKCGTKIPNNSKFCPNCGNKTASNPKKRNRGSAPKREMQKGVVKSLQDNASQSFKKKIKDDFFSDDHRAIEEKLSRLKEQQVNVEDDFTNEEPVKSKPTRSKAYKIKLLLIYIILNVVLYLFSYFNEMIVGYMFYSIIIFIVTLIRIGKEKTFNWVLKLLLLLQIIMGLAVILMSSVEYEYEQPVSTTAILIGLLITKMLMLVKGNKSVQ
jgi:hypothetical protein